MPITSINIYKSIMRYLTLPSAVPLAESVGAEVHVVNASTVAVHVKSKSPSSKVYVLPVWAMMAAPLTVPVHV